jgi:hypothetical protein
MKILVATNDKSKTGMKTERQRDRETERQRDRETERQRDRETKDKQPTDIIFIEKKGFYLLCCLSFGNQFRNNLRCNFLVLFDRYSVADSIKIKKTCKC